MKISSLALSIGLLISVLACYALTTDINTTRPTHPVNIQHAQNEAFDQACLTSKASQILIHHCHVVEEHALSYCEDEALRLCKKNNPLGNIGPHRINNKLA